MVSAVSERCGALVAWEGKERGCAHPGLYKRWNDSYSFVLVCGTHRRSADHGQGIWAVMDGRKDWFPHGRLYNFRPGYEKEESGE